MNLNNYISNNKINIHANEYDNSNNHIFSEEYLADQPDITDTYYHKGRDICSMSIDSGDIFYCSSCVKTLDSYCNTGWIRMPIESTRIKNKKEGNKEEMLKIPNIIKNTVMNEFSSFITTPIKNYFGVAYKEPYYSNAKVLNLWVKKYYKNFDKLNTNSENHIINSEFIFKIDSRTFVLCQCGNKIYDYNYNDNNSHYDANAIYLYIFGKKCIKYKKEIDKMLKELEDSWKMFMYSVCPLINTNNDEKASFKVIRDTLTSRNFDTLFFENNIEDKIINHLQSFFKDKDMYVKRKLKHKTGILLYGEPGTGKSSISGAILSLIPKNMEYELLSIDMSKFQYLDIAELSTTINNTSSNFIILLEDIDCVVKNRDNNSNGNVDKGDRDVIYNLLQFLDSNLSPNNAIFVATTNYIDKLDSAITRDGRFNLKLEIGGIYKKKAIEMCQSFNLNMDTIEKMFIEEEIDFPINQSKLQSYILKRIER